MFTRKLTASLLFVLLVATFSNCSDQKDDDKSKHSADQVDGAWLDKVAQKLRAGDGIAENENADKWLSKSKDEVIDIFMADARFYNTVFDFNTYFLGYKSYQLKDSDGSFLNTFAISKGSFHSAIAAAQEVKVDGDFFKLLSYDVPFYAQPLVRQEEIDAIFADGEKQEYDKYALLDDGINRLTALLDAEKPLMTSSFCNFITKTLGQGFLFRTLQQIRSQFSGNKFFLFEVDEFAIKESVDTRCNNNRNQDKDENEDEQKPQDKEITPDQIAVIKQKLQATTTYVNYLRTLEYGQYAPKSPLDFKEFDLSVSAFAKYKDQFAMEWFWLTLPNSSTNFDRKRASYVLKRFFCDDLTPINVEQPALHGQDKHASDAGCQACHYKLDPIGGFFRYRGARGIDFQNQKTMFFDDFAGAVVADYAKEWRSEAGQDWNVGYIRSLTDKKLNLTSDPRNPEPGVAELFALLQEAPEVRRCLVKNVFRYFVGEDISLDAGYLDHLTAQFNKQAKKNSSQAFKQLIHTVLKSESFSHASPQPGECYDFAPGEKQEFRPPCEIAALLEKNCISCHASGAANSRLSLDKWQDIGGAFGFVHTDKRGKQLSRDRSYALIVERLNTTDTEQRMPLKMHMDPVDREALFKFFSKP